VNKRLLEFSACAGLASGTGFLCGQAIEIILKKHALPQFLGVSALVILVALMLLHPAIDAIQNALSSDQREVKLNMLARWLTTFLVISGFVVEELIRTVGEKYLRQTFMDLAAAIALAGGLTLAWAIASTRPKRRVAFWGASMGLILGTLDVAFFWQLNGHALRRANRDLVPCSLGRMISIAAGNGLFFWGPVGLVGGFVVQRYRKRYPMLVATVALLLAGLLSDWLTGSQNKELDTYLIAAWGIALTLHPASQAILNPSKAPLAK